MAIMGTDVADLRYLSFVLFSMLTLLLWLLIDCTYTCK